MQIAATPSAGSGSGLAGISRLVAAGRWIWSRVMAKICVDIWEIMCMCVIDNVL